MSAFRVNNCDAASLFQIHHLVHLSVPCDKLYCFSAFEVKHVTHHHMVQTITDTCSEFYRKLFDCMYSSFLFEFCMFFQAKFYTDMPSETVSKIHLVDLAGRFVTFSY